MKTFLGLPVRQSVGLWIRFKHYVSIILFTGIWYFILNIGYGTVTSDLPLSFSAEFWNDANRFVQEVEKHYLLQAYFLLGGVILGHFSRVGLNKLGDHFFHFPRWDKWFYPVGIILVYLIINEVWGL